MALICLIIFLTGVPAMADSPLTSTKFYKEKTEPLIFQAHTDQALGLTFSPDGNKLFTCGLDK